MTREKLITAIVKHVDSHKWLTPQEALRELIASVGIRLEERRRDETDEILEAINNPE